MFMNGYFLYPAAALLMIIVFSVAGSIAVGVINVSERLRRKRKKKYIAGKYYSYYKTDDDILSDERAKRMLPVIVRGYKRDLEDYMSCISEVRLPPCVVMNWVRSVSEDLSKAALPVVNIKKWHQNMILLSSDVNVATKADSIDLKNYEECFIWGCVVRWLELFENDILDDDLKNEIFQVACPKKYLKPYYNITSMTQEEKIRIAEAIMKSGNVSIAQLSIGDHNTMNYFAEGDKQPTLDNVTLDDMKKAVAECGLYMYAVAGITVAYAIGRDLCHWTLSQSDFERKMRMVGYDCKDGTIANTLRNNPYMREHVSKWATLGAKVEVLRLRDELQKTLIGMKEKPTNT